MNELPQLLTRKQRKAIAALLGRPTVQAAADDVGVARGTIYNWLRQPAFAAELARQEQALHAEAARRLLALNVHADAALLDALRSGDTDQRLRAAQIIKSAMAQNRELSIEATLTTILEVYRHAEPTATYSEAYE